MTIEQWHDFPMGPAIRAYLGISDHEYRGGDSKADPARDAAFGDFLVAYAAANSFTDQDQFLAILEELVGMKLAQAALILEQAHQHLNAAGSFRGLLALGSAGMLVGDLDRSEEWLLAAQEMIPEELAPYTNLAQLYFHTHRDNECREWALAGLKVDANHRGLWEVLGQLYLSTDEPGQAGQLVRELATELNSWAGLSLAAMLIDGDDAMLRAQWLDQHYHEGQRDHEFLIEYTAALGMALQYERIPAIVWQAEKQNTSTLPWQLYAHGAQAQLAQEKYAEALPLLERILNRYDLRQDVAAQFQELLQECRQATTIDQNHK